MGLKFTDGSGAEINEAQIQMAHGGVGTLSIITHPRGNRKRPLRITLKFHDAGLLSSDLAAARRRVLRHTSNQVMRSKEDKSSRKQLVGFC